MNDRAAAGQLTSPARTARVELMLPVQVAPIIVRDPFLEFLGLVAPGEPIAITFAEIVKAAGHLCPTVAGAYLVLQFGLTALYGTEPATRGAVRVTAYGGPEDLGYGPIAQIVNFVVGAAPETGFGGMGRGYFHRRHLFVFRRQDLRRNEFDIERLDNGHAVHVTYNPSPIPAARELADLMGPALQDGDADAIARFRALWIGRVAEILASGDRVVHVTARATDGNETPPQ